MCVINVWVYGLIKAAEKGDSVGVPKEICWERSHDQELLPFDMS